MTRTPGPTHKNTTGRDAHKRALAAALRQGGVWNDSRLGVGGLKSAGLVTASPGWFIIPSLRTAVCTPESFRW